MTEADDSRGIINSAIEQLDASEATLVGPIYQRLSSIAALIQRLRQELETVGRDQLRVSERAITARDIASPELVGTASDASNVPGILNQVDEENKKVVALIRQITEMLDTLAGTQIQEISELNSTNQNSISTALNLLHDYVAHL